MPYRNNPVVLGFLDTATSWIPPQGEIDPSVLVAFGETSTFAGALFGVDYKYKRKSIDN